jgi:hypothetical protein
MGSLVTLLGLFALLGCHHLITLQAFTIQTTTSTSFSRSYTQGPLFAELFPAMSREELGVLLDSIPVYAVTEPDKEGLVLLKEKDQSVDIAYFFFSPETADTVYAPLREKNKDAKWDLTQYPLGVVWFELFKNPEPGIEYRLVPDPINLGGARTLLEETSKQLGIPVSDKFTKGYNEIPVFMDQRLRVQAEDGEEMFPMYVSLQDLISTLQQASGEYEAALNVADLETLLEQMQAKSENDYRKTALVPPSPESSTTNANNAAAPSSKTMIQDQIEKEDEPFTTPTATNNWDD